MTAEVIHLCQGRNLTSRTGDLRCHFRARWWASNLGSWVSDATPTCGTHSRTKRARWPLLTDDPVADRQTMEDAFR